MRGTIPGLHNPHPVAATLPSLYQEDDLVWRLASALDAVVAPIILTLDNLPSYFDPRLTPDDFLDWLAGWVGVRLDHTWPIDDRRRLVASAAALHRRRGTVKGLKDQVELFAGGHVEVTDSGGVAWSRIAGSPIPGDASPSLVVRVSLSDPDALAIPQLEAIVVATKPAHVPHRIEVAKE